MVRFTIPNHNQLIVSFLMKEIGVRSTPSLVFNLQVAYQPLSSSLPSSASSSNSSISADVCSQHNSTTSATIGSNTTPVHSSASPPAQGQRNGHPLRVSQNPQLLQLSHQRNGSTSPSSLDSSSPVLSKSRVIRNIPEWALVVFSSYFRDQVSKLLSQVLATAAAGGSRAEIEELRSEDDEDDVTGFQESNLIPFFSPITLNVTGITFPVLKMIIDLLSRGSIDVPFTKVDDVKEGLKMLEVSSYAVQDIEAKETRRRNEISPGLKPSRVFRSKSVSHMMFPIRESIEVD